MGPMARVSQFKMIEVSRTPADLQQLRWSPMNIADTPQQALGRLFMLPGRALSRPGVQLEVRGGAGGGRVHQRARARAAVRRRHAGRRGDAGARGRVPVPAATDGQPAGDRDDDPRLEDRVADNTAKFNIGESETLLFGMNFGIGTDIQTGPDGSVYVVSLSNSAVYRISRR